MAGFDWDEGNVEHIARHNVLPEECEQVFENGPVEDESETVEVKGELRRIAYGITQKGRLLTIPYTERSEMIRPITAWDMSRTERRKYAKLLLQEFEQS